MGNVDEYGSRRTKYTLCEYWIRDSRVAITDANEWVISHDSQGFFYAKESSPKYGQFNTIGAGFVFSRAGITLETEDEIPNISEGCLIKYNGRVWFVDNVQELVKRKRSALDNRLHYKRYITLRG